MDEFITQQLLQRAEPIVRAMATSKLVYKNNRDSCECQYCPLAGIPLKKRLLGIKPEEHFAGCPVRLAAAWLEKWREIQP